MTYQETKRAAHPRKGRRVTIAHSVKQRMPLAYWYWVKLPCGGWLEFDVREVARYIERELLMAFVERPEIQLATVTDFCDALPDPIANIQAAMNAMLARMRKGEREDLAAIERRARGEYDDEDDGLPF